MQAITPTAHDRSEWARMAQDCYRNGANFYGHRMSAAAAKSGEMEIGAYDTLKRLYRLWLIDGIAAL